ncbi:hypothetical protein SAMN04515666_103616 [Bosea lupini]|uniref:Uncharacterized protein n=1 Tax=Bosea lupini TaxID=1036779 RepID=A0A1H7PUI2_9HYPH|nr:hypothetical protein [Bosea lupini]SEL39510.1 hypothetical protein SAMN04515666_103616 [Bosea lupini]
MLALIHPDAPLQSKPIVKRDRRNQVGRRLLDHERRLFALIGGEEQATPALRKAVADTAELALAAEKARASYLQDELSASDLLRFQDAAREAERALKEMSR